jgi:choline dehydrogenase-like flavoprotein
MLPSWSLPILNWTSGLSYKQLCARFAHMNAFFCMARDRDTGRVYPDPTSGRPRIAYTPSAFDRACMLEGYVAACKMAYVNGAMEIHSCIAGVEPFVRDTAPTPNAAENVNTIPCFDPTFEAWLAAVRRTGNAPQNAGFGSAHQMGTCRMAVSAKKGVVDERGKVWGIDGLYIADASVFPSASGVNPMITVMAIADWISTGVAKDLKREKLGITEARL